MPVTYDKRERAVKVYSSVEPELVAICTCPNCGYNLARNVRYCPHCGNSLESVGGRRRHAIED